MPNYSYVAFDSRGRKTAGTVEVEGQHEAITRIKEMGYFPTRLVETKPATGQPTAARAPRRQRAVSQRPPLGRIAGLQLSGRIKPKVLTAFTRQLATLLEAGMPLLRGLRLLQAQESNRTLKRITGDLAADIEGGSTLSEGLARHPAVFNGLYLNMVRAGELGGVLDVVLKRLADFMEKAQKIKGKIVAASVYPLAVLIVAFAIVMLLMGFVVPKFKEVFEGMLNGAELPAFTLFVFNLGEFLKHHFVLIGGGGFALFFAAQAFVRTRCGRRWFDQLKLTLPVLGVVVRKVAISRFARTLGTMITSGVPILQALTIVKETAGNVLVGETVSRVHESVKQGETISAPLRTSSVFPAVVVGMVDIGEQTGALPEMLLKIADIYDEETDNAVTALTSLLEPILIVFLALVVGSIVIALFLPIIDAGLQPDIGGSGNDS